MQHGERLMSHLSIAQESGGDRDLYILCLEQASPKHVLQARALRIRSDLVRGKNVVPDAGPFSVYSLLRSGSRLNAFAPSDQWFYFERSGSHTRCVYFMERRTMHFFEAGRGKNELGYSEYAQTL